MASPPLARERMGRILERWFLTDPLLFSLWNDHQVNIAPVATIRVGSGVIAYNPAFIDALSPTELEAVMRCEAVRILLKHPYSRQLFPPQIAWRASNLTLREHLGTLPLPFLTAFDVFGHHQHDRQFYEFYHHRLLEQADQPPPPAPGGAAGNSGDANAQAPGSAAADETGSPPVSSATPDEPEAESAAEALDESSLSPQAEGPASLEDYAHSGRVGLENTREWGEDELFSQRIDERVTDAELNQSWGNLPGSVRIRVLANRSPRLDYRNILHLFHRSVVSQRRHLTRMKCSRRYGFLYQGSRYEFTTRLLVAVDVSGSMSRRDINLGFSLVNRFFSYGIEAIDVIAFDTEVQGKPLTLRKARHELDISGRGGTDFDAVIDYVDEHPGYDGVIIFTDGMAPAPHPPRSRRIPLLWVFIDERAYNLAADSLRKLGRVVYVRGA